MGPTGSGCRSRALWLCHIVHPSGRTQDGARSAEELVRATAPCAAKVTSRPPAALHRDKTSPGWALQPTPPQLQVDLGGEAGTPVLG